MPKRYAVVLTGCDDQMILSIDLTPSQLRVIEALERQSRAHHAVKCQPVLTCAPWKYGFQDAWEDQKRRVGIEDE